MMHKRLIQELEEVARRSRRLVVWTTLSVCWFVAALAGVGILALAGNSGWTLGWVGPAVALTALGATIFAAAVAMRRAHDLHAMAQRIEAKYPELETLLLAAVEQRPSLPGGQFGFLQHCVMRDALTHSRRYDWQEVIPTRRIRLTQIAGFLALALLAVVVGQMTVFASPRRSSPELPVPAPAEEAAVVPFDVTVEPGDTEIERGTTLVVTARFTGPVPDDAALVYQDATGETVRSPMSLSLSDPMFGGRVVDVTTDLSYRVEYGEEATREYRATVFEYPRLERADAQLVFPAYTLLGDKFVEDTRRITAVEGTLLTLTCRLNKPVADARLIDDSGRPIVLTPQPNDATAYTMTLKLENSARFRLHLVDGEGRANKQPPEFVVNVTRNQPADIKMESPARDVRVSPIEELETKATVRDDFGVTAYGVSYGLAGDPPQDAVLGGQVAGNQRLPISYVLDFEALKAEPDRLATYYFWVEDVGPDGQPRRAMSDMYFAEVRHFEEIFREGQQPARGEQQPQDRQPQDEQPQDQQDQQQQDQQDQGSPAERAEQLAEQQKEIINATWAVIRRENRAEPTDDFLPDVEQLQTAQQQALDQLASLAERLEDPESAQFVVEVERHMTEALTRLTEAVESTSPGALMPALIAEQSAYQGLLKLRAREFEVTRANREQMQQQQQRQQRQPNSASGPQSRAQQQLNQLELRNSENRYETQQQVRAQQQQQQQQRQQKQTEQQRETREALNRLRDLARRQADLNERVRQLQSALEEAQTEQEREEIERQLKRLREEEEQILRDTDELNQQMQQPQNQERMAEAQQNLEQTRENIRQTSEALEQQDVSQAVASGARAQRQLEQMREEFRSQAADRFADEARQLRDDARALAENEQQLAERLQGLNQENQERNTLRDRRQEEQDQIRQGFQQQGEDLERLLQEMQQTIEEAEETEPLMTERLYDTLRNTRQQQVDNALDVTERMVERGFIDQARSAETEAARGIDELRQGVERAAEGVLGDENEALQRAHEMLTDLANRLNEEMRLARAQQEGQQQDGQQQEGQRQGRQPQDGQQQEGQRQGGQPQDGQQQEGQRQGGQPQDGQQQQGQRQGGQPQDGQQQQGQRQGGQPQDGQQQQGQRQGGQPQDGQQQQGQRQGGQPQDGQQQQGQRQGGQPQDGQQPQGQRQGGQPQDGQQPQGQRQGGQPQDGQQQQGQRQGGQPQDGQQPQGQRQGQGGQRQGEPGNRSELEQLVEQMARGSQQQTGQPNQPPNQQGGLQPARSGNIDTPTSPGQAGPFLGGEFVEWSDQLRDVEQMLEDPDLRAESARIRDDARELRRDVQGPNWDVVEEMVSKPLGQLRDRVGEELLRRGAREAMVPIDRDPVPPKYAEQVRRYFEQLGSGQ